MNRFIFFVVLQALISEHVFSQEKWALYTLSGKGKFEERISTCYTKSYLLDNIPPLNSVMEWDGRGKPELDVNITLLGEINNIEYFDIIQEYQNKQQIKIIAFLNKKNELCPFYAWKPNNGYVENLSSTIMSAQGNLVIGHELNVYRGTNLEYFSLVNGKPSRLKFIDIAGDYIKKNYPGHYVRIKSLDIENLIYSVKLAKHTDASCCPTGKAISVFFTLMNGKLEIINIEEESAWNS